jgi:hypothetical protein
MAPGICTNLIPVFSRTRKHHGAMPVIKKRLRGLVGFFLVQPFEKIKNDVKNQDHKVVLSLIFFVFFPIIAFVFFIYEKSLTIPSKSFYEALECLDMHHLQMRILWQKANQSSM